ncbi:hypothetical protein F4703DRAFT_1720396, partial [Phycomyces blakesleeanus]
RTFFSLPDLLSSRKQYSERKLLNFSQKEVYDVVSNVKDYHLFVPFCNASHVYSSTPLGTTGTYVMKAELGVGFKLFEEKYMSQVTCKEPMMVQAIAADSSLFKELVTTWKFTPYTYPSGNLQATQPPACYVDFDITFEFASPIHAQASSVFFDQISKMMLGAFVGRCENVY